MRDAWHWRNDGWRPEDGILFVEGGAGARSRDNVRIRRQDGSTGVVHLAMYFGPKAIGALVDGGLWSFRLGENDGRYPIVDPDGPVGGRPDRKRRAAR